MAEAEKLGAQKVSAGFVGRHHRVAGMLVAPDDGDAAAGAFVDLQLAVEGAGELGVVVARAGQDDRGGLLGPKQLNVFQLPLGVAVAVADDDQAAVFGGDALQATRDLGEVGVGDVVDDDADGAALRAGQRLRVGIRHVLQFFNGGKHSGPQRLGDGLGAAVDDA